MKRLILSLMTVFSFVVQPAVAYAATTPAMSYPYSATTIYSYARGKNSVRLAELSTYDIDVTDAYGYTALCLAVRYHNEEAYYNLLDAGANPNPPCMRDLEAMRPQKNLFGWFPPKAGYALAALAVGGGVALASGGGGGSGSKKCPGYTENDCPNAQHITETCVEDSSYHKCAENTKNTEENCAIFVVNKDECQICQPEYYLEGVNCEERYITEHCEAFEIKADRCKICEDGYYLGTDGACYPGGINHCKKYSAANKCAMCDGDYVLTENADSCVLPIEHCQIHSSDGTCVRCDSNYMASMDKTACVSKIEHCSYYNNDGTCHTCSDGYSKTTDGMYCVPTIPHCENHNSDGQTCNTCMSGYHLSIDQKSCVDVIEGCAVYNADGTCQTCESNYPILENGKCYTNDSYCAQIRNMGQDICPSSQVKDFCKLQDNVTLNKNYWKCKDGPDHCQTADQEKGTCLICETGYYSDDAGQCKPQNVLHCDNDYVPNKNECKTCENLYYLNNGQCLSIEDEHCVTSLKNQKECTVCATGYYPDSNGVCQQQNVSGCEQYMENTNTCMKCINLHYLDGNTCPEITDKDGCSNSNGYDNRCDTCVTGYYHHTNGKCYSEQAYCAMNGYTQTSCQSYETKVYCQIQGVEHTGYMKCEQGEIEHCQSYNTNHTCAVCDNRYYPTNNGAQCSEITSYSTCSIGGGTQDKCTTCVSGYYPDSDNQCKSQNVANCDNDYVPNKNECKTCKNLYYLVDGQCPSIEDPHCVTSMTNAKRCSVCATGYYPDSNGVCQPQNVAECVSYTPNTNTCTKCNSMHYLNNNTCPEITDKTGCSGSDGIHNECSSCQSLYNLDSGKCYNDNDYCSVVKNMGTPICDALQTKSYCELERGSGLQNVNYWTCVGQGDEHCDMVDPVTGKCTKCESLYYPNLSGICTNITETHCAESDGVHNTCTTCNSNYYIDGGKCYSEQAYCAMNGYTQTSCQSYETKVYCQIQGVEHTGYMKCEQGEIEHCQSYNTNHTCAVCDNKYYPANGGAQCSQITSYDTCSIGGGTQDKCTDCVSGYYPDTDGVCQPQNVAECATYTPNTNTCTKCNSMHYLTNNTCPEITDKTGCAESDGINNKCSSCQSLYNLDSGKCYNDNDYCSVVKNMGTPTCDALQTKSYCELERGSGLQNENYWTCVGQGDEHCVTFDSITGKCTKCESLYYPNLSGICTNITETHCAESDGVHNTCTTCNSNYYIDGGKCYSEQAYCAMNGYTQTSCQSYETKVYCQIQGVEHTGYMKCEQGEIEHCARYNINHTCGACINKYYPTNGGAQCSEITSYDTCLIGGGTQDKCTACSTGYYPDTDGVCQPQNVTECATYTPNTNTCTKCNSLHYLTNNTCPDITDKTGCAESDGINNKCSSCQSSYNFDNGKCYNDNDYCTEVKNMGTPTCEGLQTKSYCELERGSGLQNENYWTCIGYLDENCDTFDSVTGKCTKCKNLYYPNLSGICTNITDTHCTESDGVHNTCTTCTPNYYIYNNQCYSELQYCTSILSPNYPQLTSCDSSTSYPVFCPLPESKQSIWYRRCETGTVENCTKYSQTEVDTCTQCKAKYYLSGNTCVEQTTIFGCKNYLTDEVGCAECLEGFELNNKSCTRTSAYVPAENYAYYVWKNNKFNEVSVKDDSSPADSIYIGYTATPEIVQNADRSSNTQFPNYNYEYDVYNALANGVENVSGRIEMYADNLNLQEEGLGGLIIGLSTPMKDGSFAGNSSVYNSAAFESGEAKGTIDIFYQAPDAVTTSSDTQFAVYGIYSRANSAYNSYSVDGAGDAIGDITISVGNYVQNYGIYANNSYNAYGAKADGYIDIRINGINKTPVTGIYGKEKAINAYYGSGDIFISSTLDTIDGVVSYGLNSDAIARNSVGAGARGIIQLLAQKGIAMHGGVSAINASDGGNGDINMPFGGIAMSGGVLTNATGNGSVGDITVGEPKNIINDVVLYAGSSFTNADDHGTGTINIYGTLNPLDESFVNAKGGGEGTINIYTKKFEPTTETVMKVLDGAINVSGASTGNVNIELGNGWVNGNGSIVALSNSDVDNADGGKGNIRIIKDSEGGSYIPYADTITGVYNGNMYNSESSVTIEGVTANDIYGMYYDDGDKYESSGSVVIYSNDDAAHDQSITGIYSRGVDVENNGRIVISSSVANKYINGMYVSGGAIATNKYQITIELSGTATAEAVHGMLADGTGSGVMNDTGAVISITVPSGTNVYGLRAINGAELFNKGTIEINTQLFTDAVSNTTRVVSGSSTAYFTSHEPTTTELSNAIIEVEPDSQIVNSGSIISSSALRMIGGGRMLMMSNANITAPSVSGMLELSSEIVSEGNEDVYITPDLVTGDTENLEVTSQSQMFAATLVTDEENDNTVDGVLTRKPFDTLTKSAKLANYLEKNYQNGNAEELYTRLKLATNSEEFDQVLSKELGLCLIPNFAQENFNVFRSLGSLITDNLYSTDMTQERMMVGYDYLGLSRDGKGNVTGYENNAHSSYFVGDTTLNKRSRFGLGVSITQFMSDYDDDSDRDEMFAQVLASYMYDFGNKWRYAGVLHGGYGWGDYTRQMSHGDVDGYLHDWVYGLRNELRYSYETPFALIEPQLEMNFTGYYQHRIHEENKEGSILMRGTNNFSAESGIGLYAGKEFNLEQYGRFKGRIGGSYYHEWAHPYHSIEARSRGTDGYYRIIADNIFRRDRFVISADIMYSYKAFDFYLRGSEYFEKDDVAVFNAGIKYNF